MTDPGQDLLVTSEGVNDADTGEGAGSGALPDRDGHPVVEGEQPAPPVPVDTDESRAARAADTGQQLEAGEG